MHHRLSKWITLLPLETRVFPGHDPEATISREGRYNSYMVNGFRDS